MDALPIRIAPKQGWSTSDEINFLKELGLNRFTHMQFKHVALPSRLELLSNYIAAMRLRVNWGDINKAFVFAHVNDMLLEEQMKNRRPKVKLQ